jgi:hypothetical protein
MVHIYFQQNILSEAVLWPQDASISAGKLRIVDFVTIITNNHLNAGKVIV